MPCYLANDYFLWKFVDFPPFSTQFLKKSFGFFFLEFGFQKWVIGLFACQRRISKIMNLGARGWIVHRGNCWLKKSSCTDKLCLWLFISSNCLRGSMDPCQGGLGPPALGGAISPIHPPKENKWVLTPNLLPFLFL